MKCYKCRNQASTKIGNSKGNIFKALFGLKCWQKEEIYLCKRHYDQHKRAEQKLKQQQAKDMQEVLSMQKTWGD